MASFAEIHKNTMNCSYDSMETTFKEESEEHIDPEQILKTEYREYLEYKFLHDCLLDCIDDLELNPDLACKLDDIMNDVKLEQYLKLENHNLLGVLPKETGLTYQEGAELMPFLQRKISERLTKVFTDFKRITSKDLEQVIDELEPSTPLCESCLTQNDQSVIDHKEKLVIEQQTLMETVATRNNLLEEMLNLRLQEVPKLCHQATRECKAEIESNYLKTRIAEYKMKLDIFTEVPKAIEAYQSLIKDIKQQQEESELRIEELKELKRKYEEVRGREYDEILKSYLMCKHSIEEMKKMYALVK